MTRALPRPDIAALADHWSVQPLAVAAAVGLAGWYLLAVRRLPGEPWPVRRTIAFLVGDALLVWTTCGYPQAYAGSLFWMWTAQTLALLLGVPIVIMAGQPVELLRRHGHDLAGSRPIRAMGNPLVGPAIVLVLCAVLFFGPLPGWAVDVAPVGWVLQLALVGVGAVVALPLVGVGEQMGSLAVGLALLVGLIELILDAIPGIVLRLSSHTVTTFFAHRAIHPWSPRPLHDQQLAGSILWCVAELVDLPFLALVFRRWIRADREEAVRVDTVLEAERTARAALRDPSQPHAERGDAPWWLTDPELRDRFRH